jgi:hypothetical protein
MNPRASRASWRLAAAGLALGALAALAPRAGAAQDPAPPSMGKPGPGAGPIELAPRLQATICSPGSDAVVGPARDAGERPLAFADSRDERLGGGGEPIVYSIWANPATGSWTVFYTEADGTTCAVALGTGFRPAPAPASPKPKS